MVFILKLYGLRMFTVLETSKDTVAKLNVHGLSTETKRSLYSSYTICEGKRLTVNVYGPNNLKAVGPKFGQI